MQLLKSPSRKNAPNFNLIKSKYYPINKIIFYQMKKKNYVHNIFTTNLKQQAFIDNQKKKRKFSGGFKLEPITT